MRMTFGHYIQRALSYPPHITASKALILLKRWLHARSQRKRDLTESTFVLSLPLAQPSIRCCLKPVSSELLARNSESRAALSRLYLDHKFGLLGAGWDVAGYGVAVSGLEGKRYKSSVVPNTDSDGDWLKAHVSSANLSESKRLWRMVSTNYRAIDWQRDSRSGYRWDEKVLSREIVFGTVAGADIKLPWELGRLQHCPLLALSYASAKCGLPNYAPANIYFEEYRNIILDFIALNPPRFGVQWMSPMDIALRAISLLVAYDLFTAFGAEFDLEFEQVLVRTLYEHGCHVLEFLEWDNAVRGNHYLCNLAGLVFIGAYLPSTEETDGWLAYGAHRLWYELKAQFHPDGSSFEGSTAYHRLSAETALYTTALLLGISKSDRHRLKRKCYPGLASVPGWAASEFAGIDFELTNDLAEHLSNIARFTARIERPDGLVPQFGDNDNGRFLKLEPAIVSDAASGAIRENGLDHRHLLAAFGGLLSNTEKFETANGPTLETEFVQAYAGLPAPAPYNSGSAGTPAPLTVFDDFGLYIWRKNPIYVALRCGNIGQNGFGGHAHNDQLSFEFAAHGSPFIVDTGTYVYTPLPEARNRFRSTAMHNTLSLEGREQAAWRDGIEGLFSFTEDPQAHILRADERGIVGEHTGFGKPHRRTLTWRKNGLDGIDECEVAGRKTLRFHLDPDVRIVSGLETNAVVIEKNGIEIELVNDSTKWQKESRDISQAYGERCESLALILADIPNRCAWQIASLAPSSTRAPR